MADILEYKCPNCGGIIEFDSSTQMMKCPYCDTTFDPAALQEMDQVLNNQQSIPANPAAARSSRTPPPAPRTVPSAAIPWS